MLIQLPNGFLDGADHFNYVEVDELRGRQQNYLADQELVVGNIGHVPKILEDLVKAFQTKEGLAWKGDIKSAIWKIPSSDLETILIRIRENTYGDKFYHGATCTHCEHQMKDLLLQLSDLKIKPIDVEDLLTPKTVELPKSQIEATLKPTYMRDLFDMIKITTNSQNKLITSLVPLSIKSFKASNNGESVIIDPVKSEHIEELAMSDLICLQETLNKVVLEGTVDTDIDIECSNCRKDFVIKLNVFDPSFFDPTKGSTSGNM